MKFSLFTKNSALVSPPVWEAVRKGLTVLGHTVDENNLHCDVPVIWSLLWHGRMARNKDIWEHFRKQNKNVLVIEVGGIKRNNTWKVGLNGINRQADFGTKDNDDSRAKLLEINYKPWRQDGEHILICLQHDKSEQWKNQPALDQYVRNTVLEIRKYT